MRRVKLSAFLVLSLFLSLPVYADIVGTGAPESAAPPDIVGTGEPVSDGSSLWDAFWLAVSL